MDYLSQALRSITLSICAIFARLWYSDYDQTPSSSEASGVNVVVDKLSSDDNSSPLANQLHEVDKLEVASTSSASSSSSSCLSSSTSISPIRILPSQIDVQSPRCPREEALKPQSSRSALESLGVVIKGGKKQFLSELAVISLNDYVTLDNQTYVLPYVYDVRIKFHKPWDGCRLIDVFENDLRDWGDREYWLGEINAGRLVTRTGVVSPNFIWRLGESVWHTRHVHEPPVGSEDITLIHVCERFVVVNKPATMPVHPCGTYKKNTLIFKVAARYGFRRLYVVHRIDKQVSGVVVFGRTREAAANFHASNKAHELTKTYLAEVEGQFRWDNVFCRMPLLLKEGRSRVDHENGKEAHTEFTKIKYLPETNTTLIEVRPKTGRQHQIRSHLQFLEHSIVGDPLYGNGAPSRLPDATHNLHHLQLARGPKLLEKGRELKCRDCPAVFASAIKTCQESIRLHALRYESLQKGREFCYEATLPEWARGASFHVQQQTML